MNMIATLPTNDGESNIDREKFLYDITPGTMDSGQLDVTIENCQLSWFGLINVLTYTLLGMVGP